MASPAVGLSMPADASGDPFSPSPLDCLTSPSPLSSYGAVSPTASVLIYLPRWSISLAPCGLPPGAPSAVILVLLG